MVASREVVTVEQHDDDGPVRRDGGVRGAALEPPRRQAISQPGQRDGTENAGAPRGSGV